MFNQFYRAKVEKMSLKFIIDNKFDYFCSVNWDKCMDGKSQTPQEERIKILQSLMPEVFDEGKIDWEKLKATLGEEVNFANERYVLNWAGKGDAFRVMQQPSSATLVPCREESVDFDQTENIFIEGENMEVLKVLQKSYFGKVKMIYIDPPYNTGNDSFIYPDKFSETKEEYLRRVGDKDEEGYMTREGMFRKNNKENGQYHSNWLCMMMPRLYLAKALLREDGVIFVSIDDNEVHNLRLLMNEIFGEENFVAQITIVNNPKGRNDDKHFATCNEYALVYGKHDYSSHGLPLTDEQKSHFNLIDELGNKYQMRDLRKRGNGDSREDRPNMYFPIYYNEIEQRVSLEKQEDWIEIYPIKGDGSEGRWRWGKERVRENLSLLQPKKVKNGAKWGIDYKVFLNQALNPFGQDESDEKVSKPKTIWEDSDISSDLARRTLKLLFENNLFDFPKSVELIKRFAQIGSDKDSIIVDFFAGSCTTAHAVMQLNKEDGGHRKFICVQLPELCDEKSEAFKTGYKTIAEIGKERIRRAGAKIRMEVEEEQAKQEEELPFGEEPTIKMPDLGFKVFKLSESNFKQWREIKGSNKEEWKQQALDFINPVAENAITDNMVYELLLKSGKSLNSTIEHKNGYYAINGKELILMLETATQEVVDAVLAEHPQKAIALDSLFEGNDQLKTNTALQMRDAGVEFRTI